MSTGIRKTPKVAGSTEPRPTDAGSVLSGTLELQHVRTPGRSYHHGVRVREGRSPEGDIPGASVVCLLLPWVALCFRAGHLHVAGGAIIEFQVLSGLP